MQIRNALLAMLVFSLPSTGSFAQKDPARPVAKSTAQGEISLPTGVKIAGRREKILPADLNIDKTSGDINVTTGAAGYVFTVSGKRRYLITGARTIKIRLPFNAAGIPAEDTKAGVKIFVRLFDHKSHSNGDLTGDVEVAGSTGTITVETPGLPARFTAIVIYNQNMMSAAGDVEGQ